MSKLPLRMHHHAYTTEDHELTRQFYEDVLGLPLVAMFVEREPVDGRMVELGHAFYEIGDGSCLAFFHFADPKVQAAWRAKEQPLSVHIALSVEEPTQEEIRARLDDAKHEHFTLDHGFCKSLYARDPNGLRLEFAVDRKDAAVIFAEMAGSARDDLRRWVAGDRTTNNRWRPSSDPSAK